MVAGLAQIRVTLENIAQCHYGPTPNWHSPRKKPTGGGSENSGVRIDWSIMGRQRDFEIIVVLIFFKLLDK